MKQLLIILLSHQSFSQAQDRVEDSIHIYWQPNVFLKKSDFTFDGNKEPNAKLYCDSIKLCTSAATNLNIIIDEPTNDPKGEIFEKIYIVPILDKQKSYMFGDDDLGLLHQKIS